MRMKMLLVSAVVIVVAVAGGLILGGFVSEGFLSGFAASAGSPQNESADQAGAADSSPGFKIKMGSKSGGTSDSGSDAGEDESDASAAGAANATNSTGNTTTMAFTYSGSSKKKSSGSSDSSNPEPEPEPPANDNKVYVSPSSISVGVNDTFTVSVKINSDTKVYAAAIKLTYDSSIIKAASADQGVFFTQDGADTYKIIKIDNVSGVVSYDNTRFQVADGVQGEGTILTVEFVAEAPGTSSLVLKETEVLNESIMDMQFNIEGGTVNVQ